MFVVVSMNVNGLLSYQRYAKKEDALSAMFTAKSSINVRGAWLEYEPTEKEIQASRDRTLLLRFAAHCIGEGVFSREVEEIVDEFLGDQHEQAN